MRQGRNKTIETDFAANTGDNSPGLEAANDEFCDLASAVATLTSEDVSSLVHSLNAADAWDVDETASVEGGFLANQF